MGMGPRGAIVLHILMSSGPSPLVDSTFCRTIQKMSTCTCAMYGEGYGLTEEPCKTMILSLGTIKTSVIGRPCSIEKYL